VVAGDTAGLDRRAAIFCSTTLPLRVAMPGVGRERDAIAHAA